MDTTPERLSGRARAAQQRREAAFFDPDRRVNTPVLDLALRVLGWSRSRLARELGMDRTHVSKVIHGHAPAEPHVRYKIAQLMPGIEPEELFVSSSVVPAITLPDDDEADEADGSAA